FFSCVSFYFYFFFFQAEDGIRDGHVTGVQTCALPILHPLRSPLPTNAGARIHERSGPFESPRAKRQARPRLLPKRCSSTSPGSSGDPKAELCSRRTAPCNQ